MIHLPFHFPHYFKTKLSRQLEELYLTAALMDFAGAAITLFEPIYLWTLHYGIRAIMLYYLFVYLPYFFLVPLGGKFVARFGPERSIAISTVWLVAYFAALVGLGHNPNFFALAPLFLALQKTFYWPAYHFDFMRYSVKAERGSEFSGLWTVTTVMWVLGPIIGGLVVKFLGFNPLFIGAGIIILLSSIPLFTSPTTQKREEFSYWRSLVLPFRRRYLKSTIGYLGLGEELIGVSIWTIFIFLVYRDIFRLGFLSGLGAFITAITTLLSGKWSDRSSKRRIVGLTGIIEVALWLMRLVLRQPVAVFVFDTIGRTNHNATFVSMTALTYDRAHEDDYSWHGVMYEQGFAIAKSLAAFIVIVAATFWSPFNAAFIVAAALSFFYLVF